MYDGEYVCLMRKDHPLAAGPLTLDQCAARHLLVGFSGRPYGFTDEALAALGRERRIVLTVNQFFTAGRVVANSDLLTVLPLHFFGVTGMEGTLVWRPLPLQLPTVHVDALWDVRRAGGAAQRWLRAVVAQCSSGRAPAAANPRSGLTFPFSPANRRFCLRVCPVPITIPHARLRRRLRACRARAPRTILLERIHAQTSGARP